MVTLLLKQKAGTVDLYFVTISLKKKPTMSLQKSCITNPEEGLKALNLAPLLFRTIEEEDMIAIKIGEKIVEETVRDIYALMKKLDLIKEDTPIVLGGSLYKGAPGLLNIYLQRLIFLSLKAKVSLLKVPPALGASIIAWEASSYSLSEDKWEELSNFNC